MVFDMGFLRSLIPQAQVHPHEQVWEGPVRGLDAVGTFGAAAHTIHGNADWGELLANPEVLHRTQNVFCTHQFCFDSFVPAHVSNDALGADPGTHTS